MLCVIVASFGKVIYGYGEKYRTVHFEWWPGFDFWSGIIFQVSLNGSDFVEDDVADLHTCGVGWYYCSHG